MVYKRAAIKVLLGPEHLQNDQPVLEGEKFPLRTVGFRKKNADDQEFDKIGETNVYKRTRPYQSLKSRPKLVRVPSNLTLSGQRVESEDTKLNLNTDRTAESARSNKPNDSLLDEMERKSTTGADNSLTGDRDLKSAGSCYSPTLQRTRRERTQSTINQTMSQNFLTEFGLRTERTDTFSGHKRRRGASANMKRQLEMSAERHIRTCQVVGNVKRSSKMQQSYLGLKETVSPLRSPLSGSLSDRTGLRRHNMWNGVKDRTFFNSDGVDAFDNPVSYMLQIRRNVGSICPVKPIKPQPEVTSRTIIVGTSVQFS